MECSRVFCFEESNCRRLFALMKKVTLVICLAVLFALGIAAGSFAQTAEEADRAGLEHFRLAFYELTPGKDVAGALREYQLAEQAFREAITLAPGWVDPYLHLGRSCFVRKKYREAADWYRQALDLAPERREICLQLASSLQMGGQYRQAVEVLVKLRAEENNKDAVKLLDTFVQQLEKQAAEKRGN